MANCQQTDTQTILEHGQSVWNYTKKIILGDYSGMKLPEWFIQNHHFIINQLPDWNSIKTYNVFHDCGKPKCIILDENGKRHFPNHAEVSKQTFLEYFPGEDFIAELIGLDMVMHTENFEQITARNLSPEILATLYVSALAEINSNSKMFGGIDSTSFKIKFKKLDKLGRRLFEHLLKDQENFSYIFCREDLPASQRIVQSAHAAFEARSLAGQHPSLVVLGAKTEAKLKRAMKYLLENDIRFRIFREPMEPFNNEITAICTEPLTGEKRDLLKKYQTL